MKSRDFRDGTISFREDNWKQYILGWSGCFQTVIRLQTCSVCKIKLWVFLIAIPVWILNLSIKRGMLQAFANESAEYLSYLFI